LDCHLFGDLKEALARNIAMTFWMPKSDTRKYKAGTPHEVYDSICRTIDSNGVSEHRIIEDILRIKKETLSRVMVAKGTYIEDSTGKTSSRHGVRGEEYQTQMKIKVDPAVKESFNTKLENVLQSKQQCPNIFDLTGNNSAPLVPGPEETTNFVSVDTDAALEPSDKNNENQEDDEESSEE
jgi:hypothetical protein